MADIINNMVLGGSGDMEILLEDGTAKEEPWDEHDSTEGVLDTPCLPVGGGGNSELES